jgi:hypothetical protein
MIAVAIRFNKMQTQATSIECAIARWNLHENYKLQEMMCRAQGATTLAKGAHQTARIAKT